MTQNVPRREKVKVTGEIIGLEALQAFKPLSFERSMTVSKTGVQ